MSAADCCSGSLATPFAALKGAKGDPGEDAECVLFEHSVIFTAQQVKDWYDGGSDLAYEFLPAPDPGNYNFPIAMAFQTGQVGTPYDANGARVNIYYGDADGYSIPFDVILDVLEESEPAVVWKKVLADIADEILKYSDVGAKAIVGVVDEEIEDGDAPLTVTTYYFKRTMVIPS